MTLSNWNTIKILLCKVSSFHNQFQLLKGSYSNSFQQNQRILSHSLYRSTQRVTWRYQIWIRARISRVGSRGHSRWGNPIGKWRIILLIILATCFCPRSKGSWVWISWTLVSWLGEKNLRSFCCLCLTISGLLTWWLGSRYTLSLEMILGSCFSRRKVTLLSIF